MSAFECLYLLGNFYIDIIEMKKLELSENASAAEKFHWLMIEKATLKITPLTFRSKDSSGEIEERYFEEGFLKFNSETGTFIEKYNSAQHTLHRMMEMGISAQVYNAIAAHLNAQEQPNQQHHIL